jgi:hypothetical protein
MAVRIGPLERGRRLAVGGHGNLLFTPADVRCSQGASRVAPLRDSVVEIGLKAHLEQAIDDREKLSAVQSRVF